MARLPGKAPEGPDGLGPHLGPPPMCTVSLEASPGEAATKLCTVGRECCDSDNSSGQGHGTTVKTGL